VIPTLQTERLTLRPLAVADAPALLEARSDPDVMRYWDWPPQTSVGEIETIIREHAADIGEGAVLWWAVALAPDGPAIGECDLSELDRHHRRAELGFLFRRSVWGKGYAREAAEAVIAYAFGPLGLERLGARVHAGNEASCRLLMRLGFAYEGTLRAHVLRDGARRDCLVYGRMR
jgi:ribosomal-protein-alanine N-acetyltransferase